MNAFLIASGGHRLAKVQQEQQLEETQLGSSPPTSPMASLLRLNGHTSLYWTARALAQSSRLRSIIVLCDKNLHEEVLADLPQDSRFRCEDIEDKESDKNETVEETLERYHQWLQRRIQSPTLIVTCGTLHWTGKTFDDVISHARNLPADSILFYVQVPTTTKKTPFFKIQLSFCHWRLLDRKP